MNLIWAKRLIAGTQTWDKVPVDRKAEIGLLLREWVEEEKITTEKYEEITGYIY